MSDITAFPVAATVAGPSAAAANGPELAKPNRDPARLILVKVVYNGATRRIKLPLSDFYPTVLPAKVKASLGLAEEQAITMTRYSSTMTDFVALDSPLSYHRCRHSIYARDKAKIEVFDAPASAATTESAVTATASVSSEELDSMIEQKIQRSVSELEQRLFTALRTTVARDVSTATAAHDAAAARCTPEKVHAIFGIRCDICSADIENATSYHCETCSEGDFDICATCVRSGYHCLDDKHKLVERVVRNMELPVGEAVCRRRGVRRAFCKGAAASTAAATPVTAKSETVREAVHNATCDGCEQTIRGMRFKCVDCPDFDFCGTCFAKVETTHPGHAFVKIATQEDYLTPMRAPLARHYGIVCDGDGCVNSKRCIVGTRYKCAICENYDLCERCEAMPHNGHDQSHPMIKLKTPVSRLRVTAMQEPESISSRDVAPEPKVEAAGKAIVGDVLSAVVVEQVVKDSQVYRPEQLFFQSWVIKNDGTSPWPAGVTPVFVGGEKMYAGNAGSANVSTSVFKVGAGETASFAVMLKAPAAPGKYTSFWKMVTEGGERFGENMWCEITVEEKPAAAPVAAAEEEDEEVTKSQYMDATEAVSPSPSARVSATSSISAASQADDETEADNVSVAASDATAVDVSEAGAVAAISDYESSLEEAYASEDDFELVDESE
ncbi:uncharacterized protein V1518DRAFT_425222 [Limtongia smithiae]|uniref:uncharacterized protein n=1 Tax=Limtongia smithiae TaxID=1125753 RepID=UPI0034CFA970